MNNLDAFAYLRKSRKDIEEEKKHAEAGQHYNTLDRHRSQLLELAKLKNIRIVEIFEEVVSGEFISDRPEMQKMLREVEMGSVDAILCMDLDRLGRGDMVDQGTIYRILKNSETVIITPTEIIDPQDENQELTFSIKSLIAREELKTIVKRMQRGRRQSTKEGKSITRKPPYGYLRDANLRLYPDPDTSWVVEMIFNKAANGIGQRTIAEDLDRLNIKPPESNQWEHTTVGRILRNEVYIGNIIWGKVKHTKIDGKYEKRQLPRESWQITENAHPAIISKDLFNIVNTESKRRWSIPVTKDKKLTNPLAGLIVCSNCKKSMVRYPRPDRPNDMIRCSNHKCKGIQKGAAFALVEDKILQTLESLIEEFELPEAEKKRSKSTIILKEKALHVLEKEKKEIEFQSNSIHELLEKKVYTIETFLQRQHVLKEKSQSLDDKIQSIIEEIEYEKRQQEAQISFIPKVKSVLETYHSTCDIQMKNKLLKSVIDKAIFTRKIDWTMFDHFEIEIYTKI
ncbi:recombinase family protein [Cytobacillus solani]|uniref:recombinase family protein n=1 Tax=Cytobacillus solani TaxID=1637975 RepID=UPI0020797C02|nr:recombinase family protein [Cytobacillus solani]USK56350.1 recombinase family protein [Cytobacillus solani]